MKRIISILMAALMITSTAVVGTATASAKETSVQSTSTTVSSNVSKATASKIVALANKQIGNKGSKYWNGTKAWKGGATEWCNIFCAWLLEQTNLKPSNYGWSASVSQWKTNANKKKIWHNRTSSYKMKAGDFILFNHGHSGIVTKVNAKTITVVEGNSGDYNLGGYLKSKVAKRTYNKTCTDIAGYIEL